MSTITLPRAVVAQALEALEYAQQNRECPSTTRQAITALRAALAQKQAEPVAWVASKDGRVIYDAVSTDDVLLRVSGDFETDEQRINYAKQIADKLSAPPQRTMVPLTEEEIFSLFRVAGSPVLFARAVEKASWEKNHGQA